ncbi:hypothetical protein ACQP1U_15240 [Actinomycetota bacterium]
MKKSVAALAAAAAILPIAVVAAQPAQAAGSCSIITPSKIVVKSPYQRVPISFSQSCATSARIAHWAIANPVQGEFVWPRYINGGNSDNGFDVRDSTPRGVWDVFPGGATDMNWGGDVTQNSAKIDVRLGTSGYMTVSRSGSTVNFYTRTSRWSPYYGKWIGFIPNPRATIQFRNVGSSNWYTLKTLYPDKAGVYRYSYTHSSTRYYRVRIPANPAAPGTWDYTGGQISR